ncbi:hypothetical protein PNA2_1457 [Pyrococcus sp. NA2]|uniref:transcriptional regulator n=1 Tax=Pyrococcus sp. (strain NA2) TaxID=342949 RepID=UPI000209AF91|nr:transcriptional regulator [Pyrococcus sp. NA2]AEC52373.1 hypothetical protein PNA2_1457 [Pyrococcus sp. NA2]
MKSHILGSPVRLGIMIFLLPRRRALFSEIQRVLDLTPGNLDSHLRALQREGFVKVYKVIADRPRTMIEITEKGSRETMKFLRTLKEIIERISYQGPPPVG